MWIFSELFTAKMKPHRHIALNIEAEMKKLIQINANVIKDRSLNSWIFFNILGVIRSLDFFYLFTDL